MQWPKKNQPVRKHTSNATPLLNRSNVKKAALDIAQKERAGKFTRVSKRFLERINDMTLNQIRAEVKRHPSLGKTLM